MKVVLRFANVISRRKLFAWTLVLLWTPLAHSGDWIYRNGEGKHETLCRNLVKRLNRYDRNESVTERCSWDVIASYPKFTEPPWEDLDPREHEALIVNLMKYGQESPDGYFHRLPGLSDKQPDSAYRHEAKDFIEQGGRLRVWRTKLTQFYGTNPARPGSPIPPEEQTIVQMGIPWKEKNPESQNKVCIGRPHTNLLGVGTVFIVTPDLKGPDPSIDGGTFGVLSSHALLMYEGKPLLVSSESIWRSNSGLINGYCDFEFVEGEK